MWHVSKSKSEKEQGCLAGPTTKRLLLYGSSCITIQSAHVSTREKQKMVLSKSVVINIMKHLMTASQTSSQGQVKGVTSLMQTVTTLILWLLIIIVALTCSCMMTDSSLARSL